MTWLEANACGHFHVLSYVIHCSSRTNLLLVQMERKQRSIGVLMATLDSETQTDMYEALNKG